MRKAQAPPPTSENFVFELDAHGTRTTTSEQREVRLRVGCAKEGDATKGAGCVFPTERPAAVLVKDRQKQVGMVSERAAQDVVKAFQVALNIMGALKADGCVTKEAFNAKKESELASLES